MKIKIGTGYQTFSCTVAPASGIIVSFPEDEDLDADTVSYAICRLFCRSPKFSKPYVWESYQLRLATGKERKVQRHRITIPASLAELPGGWINVKFSVAPTGIQIDRVEYLGAGGSPIYGEGPAPADAVEEADWPDGVLPSEEADGEAAEETGAAPAGSGAEQPEDTDNAVRDGGAEQPEVAEGAEAGLDGGAATGETETPRDAEALKAAAAEDAEDTPESKRTDAEPPAAGIETMAMDAEA